jgi:uncharacterized protein (DUF1015 family)
VSAPESSGLSLTAFRGLRFAAEPNRLGSLLCPPYDVIDAATRRQLIDADPDNVVRVVLPELGGADGDPYVAAAALLSSWVTDGVLRVDAEPTLYIYEMRTAPGGDANADPDSAGSVTRGLLGAVELRAPEAGVILPHENTMAGPVADRLALMEATDANLEPIYLVYDGGGAASALVASVGDAEGEGGGPGNGGGSVEMAIEVDSPAEEPLPVAFVTSAITPDGTHHRLWAVTDPAVLAEVAADLAGRSALIADGHHRYATYRQLAARRRPRDGAGPWDRGLALLVDSSAYGPDVHPIHRMIPGLTLATAIEAARRDFEVSAELDLDAAIARLEDPAQTDPQTFAAVVTDGATAVIVSRPTADAIASVRRPDEPAALSDLDVWVLHRLLIEQTWGLSDDERTVGYAHSAREALAGVGDGVAVLLRATPVAAVAAVAAAGARMPRKSTLFTPKPASGLVMRRFADQSGT